MMKPLLWILVVALVVPFVSSLDSKVGNPSDCPLLPRCEECLDNPDCGWYNYTNSCVDILSGLPVNTETCDNPDNYWCSEHSTCGGCTQDSHRCGFDIATGTCSWFKAKPNLISNFRQCPYDPDYDACSESSCLRCFDRRSPCAFSAVRQVCYDSSWTNFTGGIVEHPKQCPYEADYDRDCRKDAVHCYDCINNYYSLRECAFDLDAKECRAINANMTGSVIISNATYCPYRPEDDWCQDHVSCSGCSAGKDNFGNPCGWDATNRTCWSIKSGRKLNFTCPYDPNNDGCASWYGMNCFSALTSGKGKCGWLSANNTALDLSSGLQLMTDATKCPPLPGDNSCSSFTLRLIHKDECSPCVQINECGWSPDTQTCIGLNMQNATYHLIKDKADCPLPPCSQQKTCEDCGKVPDWACGWSYVNNTCVPSKNRFTVTQFPNMTWALHEPSDPTIALSCDLEPKVCSPEYMRPYICNKTTDPFDVRNCYTNSAVKSPACAPGFFQVNETTKDFWGKRNSNYRTVKCCPGYYCPDNFICAHECPSGSHCVESKANYTSSSSSVQKVKTSAWFGDDDDKKIKPIYCLPYLPTLISPQLGCGGAPSAVPCKEGFYCTNTTLQQTCPSDYFCRKASVSPTNCYGPPFFFLLKIGIMCPEGTVFPQTRMMALLAIPFLLVLIPLAYWAYHKFSMYRSLKEKQKREKRRSTDPEEDFLINRESQKYGTLGIVDHDVDLEVDIKRLYIEPIVPLNVTFNKLTVTLDDGKVILNKVDGTFFAGRLTAIMGPSGSGKTTLLSAIMGKVTGRTGNVYPKVRKCKSVLGFVPQEDVMHRELTVRENLMFSAKLRCSNTISRQQRRQIVKMVLDLLGLAHVQSSVVGDENVRGISGGQRKRVNIGMELVTLPSLLFLDEPTSGLDAYTSLSVCQVLKKLTEVKVNVVAVIHQPRYDIFDQFDDILLLKKGGSLVYSGPKEQVLQHFADQGFNCPVYQNPCDYLLDLISTPTKIKPRNGVLADENTERINRKTTGKWMQTWWIFVRGVLQQWRQSNTAHSDIMLCIFSGVVVEMVYRNVAENLIPQAAFLLVLVASLTSMVISLRLFGAEKPVFWRESASGMSSISYFFGKNFASFPSYIITSVIFLLFYYSISQPRGSYEMYFWILIVNHFCISGLAHFLSVIMHPHKAQLFGVIATMLQCSICGFAPTLTSLKQISLFLYYGAYGGFAKWMMEALFIVNVRDFSDALSDTRDNMVQVFGYDLNNLTKCFLVLVGMGLFWRTCTLLALIFANRQQRR
eukprot:TRINITY_DN6062_c1_g2_i2.p1 TRINITY_DN6062_c1_g2~~TRINITY_DN6062_c1_g2_i2.p1  ORF type:complete len:1280 (+),score=361.96 TRINITY_DN6062_c1_g2_i2:135-3974(+)